MYLPFFDQILFRSLLVGLWSKTSIVAIIDPSICTAFSNIDVRKNYTCMRVELILLLSVLPGNQPGAAALENLGTQTGSSFTWQTDIAAGESSSRKLFPSSAHPLPGTSVGLTLRDSTGALAQSAAFLIQPGGRSHHSISQSSTYAST